MRIKLACAVALAVFSLGWAATEALAQKQGGTLRIYNRDNPPSGSIHEEATISTVRPFMACSTTSSCSTRPRSSIRSRRIVPELAESWAWDASKTKLTFKLRQGVKWHDGKPFTAKDVQCTWHKLTGKDTAEDFRKNPRAVWYHNLKEVTVNGDHEVTFVLKAPQPSFLALLASGYSPVYPCHVPPGDAHEADRHRPVQVRRVQARRGRRVVRNPDYWKKGKPYLDAIEWKVIDNRSTRMLAFVAGEFDMTFSSDVTIPLLKDMTAQAPKAMCELAPSDVSINLIINPTRRRSTIPRCARRWRWRSTARRSSTS